MRAPALVRWPGVIRPGTIKNDIFASLDWLPRSSTSRAETRAMR